MSTNDAPTLEEFGTTDEPTATDDNPREECWCAGNDLACFDHWQAERDARGEF